MKKFLTILTVIILCTIPMLACTDTDGGPENTRNPTAHELETRGEAGYAISKKADTCLTFQGGVSTDEGIILKEYYCKDDVMDSIEYDCTKYGYVGCKDGECYGGSTTAAQNSTGTTATAPPEDLCGNEIVDDGEDCDPPYSICFGEDVSEYGQCGEDCKCELAHPEHPKCGNGVIDEGEKCEEDSDCENWEHCKECLCVERPNSESIKNTSEEPQVSTEPKEETKQEIEKKYPTKNVTQAEIGNITNFTAEPAIQTTSGIAKFFIGIWDWIKGLFS